MLECCPVLHVTAWRHWLGVGICSLIVLAALVRLFMRIASEKKSEFSHDVSVSLASGVVFMLLTVPIITGTYNDSVPLGLRVNYCWLPFWYCFVLCKRLGDLVELAWQSYAGSLVTLAYLTFLNTLMPGGATTYNQSEDAIAYRLFPGGYSVPAAWAFTALFIYGVHFADCSVATKQYALGFYAGCIVPFMNPATPPSEFSAVILGYDGHIHWMSFVLGQYYVMFFAVPLAAFTMLLVPCYSNFSCAGQAALSLSSVAADTLLVLERLLKCFAEDVVSDCHRMDSSEIFISELGTRRSTAESLLTQARWEVFGRPSASARLARMNIFSNLLQQLRQFLRALHMNLRDVELQKQSIGRMGIEDQLRRFHSAIHNSMELLASLTTFRPASSKQNRLQVCSDAIAFAGQADEEVCAALQILKEGSYVGDVDLVNFLVLLKSCSAAIRGSVRELEHLDEENDEDKVHRGPCSSCLAYLQGFPRMIWSWRHLMLEMPRHRHALRNTIAWLLALFWSTSGSYAAISSTCVTAVSFLFSPTLGSLFERNMDRIFGVAMGLFLGAVPFMVLRKPYCSSDSDSCFHSMPQGLIIYLECMFVIWTVPIYGYLATFSKHAYAYLLWAGFGGVGLLNNLMKHGATSYKGWWDTLMDNLIACLIVFLVDSVFAVFTATRNAESLKAALPKCLDDAAAVFEGDRPEMHLMALHDCIAECRFFEKELAKEEQIWSSTSVCKISFIHGLLNHLDELYVCCWRFLDGSGVSGDRALNASGVHRMLSHYADSCRLFARVLRLYFGKIHQKDRATLTPSECNQERSRLYPLDVADTSDSDSDTRGAMELDMALSDQQFCRRLSAMLAGPETRMLEAAVAQMESETGTGEPSLIIVIAKIPRMLKRIEVLLEDLFFWEAQGEVEDFTAPEACDSASEDSS